MLQCRELPPSACRMRVLKLFYDIAKDNQGSERDDYEVVIRTKVGQDGVKQLLLEDLCPTVPFRVEVGMGGEWHVGI